MKHKFTLYPAIDVKNGKCVRLLYGDMAKSTEYGDPIDQALWFMDQGAEWLHVVDLDGAMLGANVNKIIIQKLMKAVQNRIKVQIGGGIRKIENFDFWLQNSAERVIIGTLALENTSFIDSLDKKYYKKLIIGADVRDGMIASHGWKKQSDIKAIDLINKFNPSIINSVIYTDITKDGSLKGVSLNQTVEFSKSIKVPVIASGGVSSLNDVINLCEQFSNGIHGVVIGKALYDKKFTFSEALQTIKKV